MRLLRFFFLSLLPFAVARAQTVDPTLSVAPNSYLTALALQPDGKVLVGGFFTLIGGVARNNFARFNADGTLDSAFNPLVSGYVASIVLQPDGKIVIGGNISAVSGQSRGRLVRLNADGTLDSAFNPNVTGSQVRAIALQPDGKIIAGGDFSTVAGQSRSHLARLHPDGTLDPGFIADIIGSAAPASPGVFALALQPDGAVVVGGQFIFIAGQSRAGLARLSASGAIDADFNPATTTANVVSLLLQRDGKILVGGGFSNLGGSPRSNLARLLPSGLADPTFNPGASSPSRGFAEQPDGKILVGGTFTTIGGVARSYLARLHPSGNVDTSFSAEASGVLGTNVQGIYALQLTPDGRLYAAGGFTTIGGSAVAGLARFILPAPSFANAPANAIVTAGSSATFAITLSSGTANYQWRKNGVAIPGATTSTLTLVSVQASDVARYDVVATNDVGSTTSSAATLALGLLPTLTNQPSARTAGLRENVTLTVTATGTPAPTYQWQKDGAALPGATSASLTFASTQFSDAGLYSCIVTNAIGRVTTTPVALTIEPDAHLTNVSVRTSLATAGLLIVGYVVSGGSTEVLVRAAGPSLADFGVAGAMSDPRLELYRESTKILENDNWPAVLAPTAARVGAFPFTANSRDAAILQSSTDASSILVTGTGSGVVLVETYDAGPVGPARFINLSARNRVGTDSDILIAGFTLAGRGTRRLLVRAVGPTLGGVPFNLPGTLADPQLSLFDAAGRTVATNDNWDASLATTFIAAGAFALAPASRDAALLVTLPAGSYTAQVSGVANTTGAALVEVYEIP